MLSAIYSESAEVATKPVVPSLSSYFISFRQKVLAAVAVIVLLVSGTSYASALSLPGDLLYGMKINIIEPIGLALRFSEESKNEYRILLLQKRVAELESLQQRGGIDEDAQKASSEAANKNVKELERSAIFDEKGENTDVSEKVKIYNNLIDAELKIETNINIDGPEELDVTGHVDTKEAITDVSGSGANESNDPLDIEATIEVEKQTDLPLQVESGSVIQAEIPGL